MNGILRKIALRITKYKYYQKKSKLRSAQSRDKEDSQI